MNKPRLRKLVTTGALILSTSALSLPAISHQGGEGKGQMPMMGGGPMSMMGGMPMMGGDHMGMMGSMMGSMMGGMPMMGAGHMGMMSMYKGLGLNDQQKQQMVDIQHKLRKKHWEIMGQMIDQHAALQKAYAGDRPDPKAVGAVYSQIFDLKRQMIEASLEAKNSANDILTEEQRAQMKKMRHPRGMMQGQGGMMQGQGGMMQGQGGMMQGEGSQTN